MTLLMLLYIFASNGLTVQGWCWGLAWAMFGLRLFFAFVKALVDMVQKNSRQDKKFVV